MVIRVSRTADRSPQAPAAFALGFVLFTYAFLSLRTEMLLGENFALLSLRRLAGTAAGGVLYWWVLQWLEKSAQKAAGLNPFAVIGSVLPASILVLAVRLVTDQLFYNEPLPLERNVGWVLVWAGYFGMWVSAALAFQTNRPKNQDWLQASCAKENASWEASVPMPIPVQASQTRRGSTSRSVADISAVEWLIDATALELQSMPRADRKALMHRLKEKAGYELADELADELDYTHNARHILIARLLARLRSN